LGVGRWAYGVQADGHVCEAILFREVVLLEVVASTLRSLRNPKIVAVSIFGSYTAYGLAYDMPYGSKLAFSRPIPILMACRVLNAVLSSAFEIR